MATIPRVPQRSRLPGIPGANIGGGPVSAGDLGAENYRNWMRLGQAGQGAGVALQRYGIQQFEREAEAEALAAQSSDMSLLGEERNRLMSLTGSEAAEAPRMLEDAAKQRTSETVGSLKNPLAKEIYSRRMDSFNRQNALAVDAFALQESERYRQTGLLANIDQEMNNAVLNAGKYRTYADEAIAEATRSDELAIKQMAREMERAGIPRQQIQEEIERLRPEMVEAGMAAAKGIAETVTADRTAIALRRQEQLEDEFNAAGGIVTNMASYNEMTPLETTEWGRKQEAHEKATAQPARDPDISLYLGLNRMTDDAFNDRWSDTAIRNMDIEAMGGVKSEWSKEQISRINKMSREANPSATEKTPEMRSLESDLAAMDRKISLYNIDSGRNLRKDDYQQFKNRTLADYRQKLIDHQNQHNLDGEAKIPFSERERMQNEALLTYRVAMQSSLLGIPLPWDTTLDITSAEAQALGLSTTNARLAPYSLPTSLRSNYRGGEIVRSLDENGEANHIAKNIPRAAAPVNVRDAVRNGGTIMRELETGEWGVELVDGVIWFDVDGNEIGKADRKAQEPAPTLREQLFGWPDDTFPPERPTEDYTRPTLPGGWFDDTFPPEPTY